MRLGSVAVFECFAEGNPAPSITWRRNGKKLTNNRYTMLPVPGGSILRIDPVKLNRDDSTFDCVAENGVADIVVATARLNIVQSKLWGRRSIPELDGRDPKSIVFEL